MIGERVLMLMAAIGLTAITVFGYYVGRYHNTPLDTDFSAQRRIQAPEQVRP
jgi:hypothetical protein